MKFRMVTLAAIVLLGACSSPNTSNKATLYQQLGGESGVETLVDYFIKGIARDEQVLHYFAKANVTHFRKGFILHLCDISNGPCSYDGDNMVDIHTGMNINEGDFNRIVEILIEAMEEVDLPYTTQNRLLSRLAPLRKDVIKL